MSGAVLSTRNAALKETKSLPAQSLHPWVIHAEIWGLIFKADTINFLGQKGA